MSKMEKERKNLVTGNKESANILTTQQCPLMTKGELSNSPPPSTLLEHCISEASITSSDVYGMMLYDPEVKEEDTQPATERAALNDCNKMCQIGPQEFDSNMSGNGNQPYCCGTQKLQLVEQTMVQISDLSLDNIDSHSTALRCQGMLLLEDLSQVEPSLWAKEKLLRVCIASIFALPSVNILQRQNGKKVNIQALYNQTVEAMEAMLKCLLSERPNTTELCALLGHLAPWMTSGQAHERARAVKAYVSLLKFAATCPMFHMSHDDCSRLGLLIGQLCLRLNDPKKEIGQHAMEGMYFLYSLMLHRKGTEMNTDSLEAEPLHVYEEVLGAYDPTTSQQNIARIIKEFAPYLTSRQMTELFLTAIGCLKEANRSTTAASHTITSVILEQYKHKLRRQVPEIVNKIYQQLGSIYQFQDRHIMMGIMTELAHTYMAEVCSALLRCPFPVDRYAAEMWYVLTKTCSYDELTVLVNVLLKKLQRSPKSTGNYITPLAAASAFCKLLSMPKCSNVALDIYPRLLMALLVQVHYSIRHSVIKNSDSEEEFEPVGYIVTALKTLLLAARCYCEFALIEKEQGWELLTSCNDHHRGVALLARIMLQCSYYFNLLRILYLLVPFLERGDEEHQITAMAFFIELLCMSEARRLPKQYSLYRLKRGLEVKVLLPAMTKGLSGMDGQLFVETVAEIEKILAGTEGADCICNLTLSLQELFSDERESVRASAICLFGKMVKRAKKSNKLAIKNQILESMVPLLLHLQEEDYDITTKCRYALHESCHFLGWKLPKQLVSKQTWHEHEDVLHETCQYLVQKQEGNLQRFLYQGLYYTESPLLPIKRASIMFLGFLVQHMYSRAGKIELDMIIHALEGLMHDPDASVCIAAAHAHDRVSSVHSKEKDGLDGNSKRVASDTATEDSTRNSRTQNIIRSSPSRLFAVISLWKSANGN
ncbi:maestro heat-like repeat-containing protein family member 7 isoform X3 [Rhineura floridana]|uniref:maestro heat-like repeat-containing protein family member 7 isoform X3 n=1 Tax=Rhineura floridana TaxID=261503 RepID=UPI002AC8193B|nr:maestro heat-like repeat-containing protein family member 7 isoform X3 [Rhineura floridana]